MTNEEFLKYFKETAYEQLEEYTRRNFNNIYRQIKGELPKDPEALKEALREENMKRGKLGKLTVKGRSFFKSVTMGVGVGSLLILDLGSRLWAADSDDEKVLAVLEFVRDNALWTAVGITSTLSTGSAASFLLPGIFISWILQGMDEAKTEEFIRYSARQDSEDYPGDHEPKPSEITPPDPTEIGPVPDEDKAIKESRKSISKLNVLIG